MEERKRKCVSLGLLSEPNKNLVKSVYEPLPVFDDHVVSSISEDDENDMFITPVPRQSGKRQKESCGLSQFSEKTNQQHTELLRLKRQSAWTPLNTARKDFDLLICLVRFCTNYRGAIKSVDVK